MERWPTRGEDLAAPRGRKSVGNNGVSSPVDLTVRLIFVKDWVISGRIKTTGRSRESKRWKGKGRAAGQGGHGALR